VYAVSVKYYKFRGINVRYLRTCCFIDHDGISKQIKNQLPDFKYELREITEKLIKDLYVTHFVSGMGLGFEQSSAEVVNELKGKYPGITLEAVLPYETFTIEWNEEQRDKYYSIMQKIDKETLMQYHYTKDCISKRNIFMINKSNYIILLCSNTSEIYNLTLYAKANKKSVFIIQPDTLNIIPQIRIHR
jgi:uncharacterized phage-like protein YoqJ